MPKVVYAVRIPPNLLAELKETVVLRRSRRKRNTKYSITDFILAAIREKLSHDRRNEAVTRSRSMRRRGAVEPGRFALQCMEGGAAVQDDSLRGGAR